MRGGIKTSREGGDGLKGELNEGRDKNKQRGWRWPKGELNEERDENEQRKG